MSSTSSSDDEVPPSSPRGANIVFRTSGTITSKETEYSTRSNTASRSLRNTAPLKVKTQRSFEDLSDRQKRFRRFNAEKTSSDLSLNKNICDDRVFNSNHENSPTVSLVVSREPSYSGNKIIGKNKVTASIRSRSKAKNDLDLSEREETRDTNKREEEKYGTVEVELMKTSATERGKSRLQNRKSDLNDCRDDFSEDENEVFSRNKAARERPVQSHVSVIQRKITDQKICNIHESETQNFSSILPLETGVKVGVDFNVSHLNKVNKKKNVRRYVKEEGLGSDSDNNNNNVTVYSTLTLKDNNDPKNVASSSKVQEKLLGRNDSFSKRTEQNKLESDTGDPDTCWIGKGRGSNILKTRKNRASERNKGEPVEGSLSKFKHEINTVREQEDKVNELTKLTSTSQESKESSGKESYSKKTGRLESGTLNGTDKTQLGVDQIESESTCSSETLPGTSFPHNSGRRVEWFSDTDNRKSLEQNSTISSLKEQENIHYGPAGRIKSATDDESQSVRRKALTGQLGKRGRRGGKTNILEKAQNFERKVSESEGKPVKKFQDNVLLKYSERRHDSKKPQKIQKNISGTDGKGTRHSRLQVLQKEKSERKIQTSLPPTEESGSDLHSDDIRRVQLGPKPTIAEQEAFILEGHFPVTPEPGVDPDTSEDETAKPQLQEKGRRPAEVPSLTHDYYAWKKGLKKKKIVTRTVQHKTEDITIEEPQTEQLNNTDSHVTDNTSITAELPMGIENDNISLHIAIENDPNNDDSYTIVSDADDSTPKESTISSVTTEADIEDTSTLSAFSQDEVDINSQTDGETQSQLTTKPGQGIRHPGSHNKQQSKSSMSSVIYAKRIQQWAERERDQTFIQNNTQKELFQVNGHVKTSRSFESDKDNAENNSEELSKELQVRSNKTTMSSRIFNQRNLHKGIEPQPRIRFLDNHERKAPGNGPLSSHVEQNQLESTSITSAQPKSGDFHRSKIYFHAGKVHNRPTELDTNRSSVHVAKPAAISSSIDAQREQCSIRGSRESFGINNTIDGDLPPSIRQQIDQKLWQSESDTDVSTGEEQLETDSSVCNVVEERRRRRLVKRTKKRGNRYRKLKREDYQSVGSASDESGAVSRTSSVDRYDDDQRLEDTEGVITGKQSTGLSTFGRKISYPVYNIKQATVRGFPTSAQKEAMKSASTSTFPKSFFHRSLPLDMGSKSDQEGRDGRLNATGKLGNFSGVAKISKVTLPSIKSFQKTSFSPPPYSAKHVLSDSESYVTTSMGEIKDYSSCRGEETKIVCSPFSFRKYRGYGERYSDDEHEMTARLERYEELNNITSDVNLRRCNTLPRNADKKHKVAESPFKLNLPGRGKTQQDVYSRSNSSPGNNEKLGFTNSPFSLKQNDSLLPESRSTTTLHNNIDENLVEHSRTSTNTGQEKLGQLPSDINQDVLTKSLKTGDDLLSKPSLTDYTSNVISQTIRQYGSGSHSNSPTSIVNSLLSQGENSFEDRSPEITSTNVTSVIQDTYIPVIEPPDNFKDTPCRASQSGFSIGNDDNNNDQVVYPDQHIPTVGNSLAEQISSFLKDVDLCYVDKGGTETITQDDSEKKLEESSQSSMVSLSYNSGGERNEFSCAGRGGETPRRRASYIKAQDSIIPDLIGIVDPPVVPPPPVSYEAPTPDLENENYLSPTEQLPVDGEGRISDENLNSRRSQKRARPRIPTVLDLAKPVNNDPVPVIEQKHLQEGDVKLSGRKEDGGSDSDELPMLDLSKVEKMESIKKRNRPVLAVTPILEGIPEEKGGDSSRANRKEEERTEAVSHRKSRKSKKQNSPSPTSMAENGHLEGMDERLESPKNERDDKSETGYYSQSSDLLSTPSQLSIDDISQDGTVFQDIDYLKTKGFRKSRTLDSFKDTDKSVETVRSKSDPLPDRLSSDETKRINETIKDIEIFSSSEPNLIPREKVVKDIARRTVSNQDVVQRDTPKSSRKERKGSGDSAVDTLSPTNDTVSFDSAFESLNSKSQLNLDTDTIPSPADTPVIPKPKNKEKPDMRRHVLQNLLETEKSYVQNLNYVVTMVYKPLKKPESGSVIEPQLVDEIFFQIPEILVNHEFFLEQLTNRVNNWHERQVIGDIFISSFRKCLLMDAYSTFISHYLQARAAVRQATQARPSFGKFLEQCTKDHKEKLTLQDLMIMPVQRIPRYTLILKDMLKHTDVDHPDYGNLQLAIGEIKTLAERMNKGEMEADQAEREAERLRDIEATIEGVTDLVATNRKFIRQDLVAEVRGVITKKDRCLFLFSDLLLCATVKRKTTALRRGSLGLFSGQSATDFNKYKLLWKIPLEDIELVKSSTNNSVNRRGPTDKQVEKLEEDISILSNVSALTDSLTTPHQNLDLCIRELMTELNKQISERSQVSQIQPPPLTRVELQVQAEEGVDFFLFVFLSAEIKSSWEAYFEDAKQKLAYCRDTFPPEFQYSMPITKTRSGMQFTCAAPSHLNTHGELHYDQSRGDVWVCNSDGYVGQVCLLAVVPKAEPKAVLSVCSARIQCISPVPGARLVSSTRSPRTSFDTRKLSQIPEATVPKKNKLSPKLSSPTTRITKSIPSESEEEDQPPGPETIIAFDSSDEEDGDVGTGFIGGSAVYGGRMSPDGSSLGTAESIEGEQDSSSHENQSDIGGNDSSEDDDNNQQDSSRRISMPIGSAMRRGSHGYTLKGSLDDLLGSDIDEQPTMWLGTEDGSIYVYQANEAATARKSKMKMQLGAAVNAILYVDNKVFVALASGELCVYKRDTGAGWEVATPQTVQVGTTGTPITCIAAVAGRIWCGCQTNVILVNAATLKVEKTLTVSSDPHRSVYKIAGSGLGVWISLQSSAVIRLYHATTLENLTDIDVAPAVHKMLAGADAIIRQHKAACLRVTALLTCKDQLWIGTSAGVILTNPLPPITLNTQSLRHIPGPSGSPHGHTGHVRFLTSVEVPKSQYKTFENNGLYSTSQPTTPTGKNKQRELKVRPNEHENVKTVTLVMSGGDGYEDFRSNTASEAVGRDDSTNHLLIWRV